eukprot:gene4216-4465_t
MMVATCQLDIGMLLQSFDLAPYDGFLEPDTYEQWEEFCALSIPDNARQPPLAALMSRLPPLPNSNYPETLMLLHKGCLQPDAHAWDICFATPEDMVGLHGLIGSMSNATEMQETFLHALGRQGVVLAKLQGEVVAMAATKPGFDVQVLAAHFQMDMGLSATGANQEHAELAACVINPIFARSVGMFMAGRF